jgi:hypothetical protein
MNATGRVNLLLVIVFGVVLTTAFAAQGPSSADNDPFDQKLASVELNDESIFDAIARLNQSSNIAISIEGIVPAQGTVQNPKFKARIDGPTLTEALSWFCKLDTRYSWSRDGNMANIFPSAVRDNPSYFFNRKLPELRFQDIRQSDDAAITIVHQLGDPSENLYFLGVGGTQSFSQPWTATFHDITVRQGLNRIAQQLGPTYGWQIGGHTGARLVMFHYKLGAGKDYNIVQHEN